MRLLVISPDLHWQVIANGKKSHAFLLSDNDSHKLLAELGSEEILMNLEDNILSSLVLHCFEETPAISTYIYGLFAGRFKCFLDNDQEKVPMRIFTT